MCEALIIIRIIVFILVFSMGVFGVFYGAWFCKKRNINMNTFSGMFEMYKRVFSFENKRFSIVMLGCMYGGGFLVLIIFGITFWGAGQGCVFPTRYG